MVYCGIHDTYCNVLLWYLNTKFIKISSCYKFNEELNQF